jgi:hypothetical protein
MYVKVYKGIQNGKTVGSWQANTKKKEAIWKQVMT